MFCLNLNTPKSPLSQFHHHHHHRHHTTTTAAKTQLRKPISATLSSSPPNPQQQQPYQPFRPPPSPLPPKFRSLDTPSRLDVLSNRLGLWYEYAPLISALIHDGFTPPTIEETTGISSVEQNRLIVGTQVRDSLVQSKLDPEVLAFFDNGGAALLYEIRLLNAMQRAAAARYLAEKNFDPKGAQDVARAIKDFPRRKGDEGWDKFSYTLPGDCLSYMYYRQSREHKNPSEQRTNALQQALEVAETENAKNVILEELEAKDAVGKSETESVNDGVRVPVVRMKVGEVAEATSVVVLPVCKAEEREREILQAPWEIRAEGEFGVVSAEKGWSRWVALPGWEPLLGLVKGGVVIAFSDARILPWKANRWYKEEAILVVADRGRKDVVANDGFYLVAVADNSGRDGLKVNRGSALKEMDVKESLGTVVLVVRPPKDDNDNQLSEEDWE